MDEISEQFFKKNITLNKIVKDMKVDSSHVSLFLRGFLFDGYVFSYCENNNIDYYKFMCSDKNTIRSSKVNEFDNLDDYKKYCKKQRIETIEEKFKTELSKKEKDNIINMYFRNRMSFNSIACKLQRKPLTISKFINTLNKDEYNK